MDARQALDRLERAAEDGALQELCARHGVAILTAFGSAVHPGGREPDDLDLAVRFLAGHGGDPLALLDALAELTGYSDLDLMDVARADPVARVAGLTECRPLFEAEPYLFAREQLRAMQAKMDTAWLRDIELRRLAG